MLRFTPQQELAVNTARQHFNLTATALAAALPAGGELSLVGNASPIPIDAWRRLDGRFAQIQRDVLNVFNRLAAANTTPLSVADLVSYFGQISDSGQVSVTMDGRHTGSADQATVKYVGTPVPAITSEARFGWRQMAVIQKGGGMIDTDTVSNHQRRVAEKLESLVLNGDSSIVVGGATIYGLRTHPQRNTDVHGFDLSATTGANWLAAFQRLINALVADNAFGRVTVFLNYADWVYASINEFTAGYPKTILQRLREIEQIADIIPASRVPADDLIGIAGIETGDWGSILSAMPMATVPKVRQNAQDDYVFQVMAMAAPQLRSDFDGKSPIAHLTAA